MRIGVVPRPTPAAGGIYQYGVTLVEALRRVAEPRGDDVVLVRRAGDSLAPELAAAAGPVDVVDLPVTRAAPSRHPRLSRLPGWSTARRARARVRAWRTPRDLDAAAVRPELRRALLEAGVELLVLPAPDRIAFEGGLPSVVAVHDLQHRLQPRFPEVGRREEREAREHLLRNVVRHATVLVAESEVGKEDLLALYGDVGPTADRVHVLPYVPAAPPALDGASVEEVRRRHGLPERYFFYPAQLWPHKNHAVVVEAAARLRRSGGGRVDLVFTGGDAPDALRRRTLRRLRLRAAARGLRQHVHVLWYVDPGELAALYAGAVALVMPTFFGPTNIPVLEAWALGCPVVTSDLRGIREQAGDAALLVDPASPAQLADALGRLWSDEALRAELAGRGKARVAAYGPDDFARRLDAALTDAVGRSRAHAPTRTRT